MTDQHRLRRPLLRATPGRADAPQPAVLILHELGGLNNTMRAVTRRLAVEGYVAVAPDLYAGTTPLLGLARLVHGVVLAPIRNRPLTELRALVARLQTAPDVDPERIAVIGFSMGAAFALQLACSEPAVRAAAIFCGQLPRPRSVLRGACPIVASYAGRDLTTTAVAPKLAAALTGYGIPHDVKVYPGARHAFYDPYGSAYDRTAASDAWSRTLAHLARHLPQTWPASCSAE